MPYTLPRSDSVVISGSRNGLLAGGLPSRWRQLAEVDIRCILYVGVLLTRLAIGSLRYAEVSGQEALAGIVISHTSHLISVLILYELTLAVFPRVAWKKRSKTALLAATLHIISPAGIFLSAPYAEGSFSLLNFAGFYLYAYGSTEPPKRSRLLQDCFVMSSGAIFGIATTFRGNGLFSGLILVWDAITSIIKILQQTEVGLSLRSLVVVSASGVLMACVALVPQYLAYIEYCWTATEQGRPWCAAWIPSIYAYVQKKYW